MAQIGSPAYQSSFTARSLLEFEVEYEFEFGFEFELELESVGRRTSNGAARLSL